MNLVFLHCSFVHRKRQNYSADQVKVLRNALALGELTTMQEKTSMAELLSSMMDGRKVSSGDVALWVRNNRKK